MEEVIAVVGRAVCSPPAQSLLCHGWGNTPKSGTFHFPDPRDSEGSTPHPGPFTRAVSPFLNSEKEQWPPCPPHIYSQWETRKPWGLVTTRS